MKKVISILAAVLLIALSVVPAFAESVDSPTAPRPNYIVTIVDVEGGSATFEYVTEVDNDGKQTIKLVATTEDGYEFTGWTINDVVIEGQPVLEYVINSDVTVTPAFVKKGETKPTTPAKTDDKVVDNGDKSPKTGEDFAAYAILAVSAIALAAVVTVAKRRSAQK